MSLGTCRRWLTTEIKELERLVVSQFEIPL